MLDETVPDRSRESNELAMAGTREVRGELQDAREQSRAVEKTGAFGANYTPDQDSRQGAGRLMSTTQGGEWLRRHSCEAKVRRVRPEMGWDERGGLLERSALSAQHTGYYNYVR